MIRRIATGVKFWHDGLVYECLAVNECSARCLAVTTRDVTVTDKHGQTRSFTAKSGRTVHLAPTSLVEEAG